MCRFGMLREGGGGVGSDALLFDTVVGSRLGWYAYFRKEWSESKNGESL